MEDLSTILKYIYLADVALFLFFYLLGTWAIKKESKDTWKGEKTMEVRKSNKLSKEWEKKHPILDFFQSFKYEVGRKIEIPGDFYYNIKYFIQRGKKGYSLRDVWGFDYYLSDIIVKGLTDLKEMAHGIPGGNMIGCQTLCIDENNKEEQKALKSWRKDIDRIIWTFEISKKIQDRNWIPVNDEKDRVKLKKYERRLNTKTKDDLFGDLLEDVESGKYHLMTKTEMQRYRNGWKLFQKYYFDLWD